MVAYLDGTGNQCEAKSDSAGSYRVAVGNGASVVYQAPGYRALARRWPQMPQMLTPSKSEKEAGEQLRTVVLDSLPWPPAGMVLFGILRGKVHDASTGAPIEGVCIVAHFDRTAEQHEAKSNPLGYYGIGLGDGACVVYQAIGYHTLSLRWPEDLSPSDTEMREDLRIRVVALEPMP